MYRYNAWGEPFVNSQALHGAFGYRLPALANVTIERRGRKGRKERLYFFAAFAAFAFQSGVT